MRYDVTQVTVYDWGAAVPFADCAFRLIPIERRGQRVHASELSVDPAASTMVDGLDYWGNHVTRVGFRRSHRRLTIRATATVTVAPPPRLDPDPSPAHEVIRDLAQRSRSTAPDDPVHFTFPSRWVPLTPAVTDWAAASFPPGRTIAAGALDLTRRIRADFAYDPAATDVATPLARAFQARRGVCQDFAHVMIAGLRGLGLPAAYVSGYLRTVPPPGQKKLAGADAMHAWVEVWCGPDLGWIGFDPTNGIVAGDDHIVVGHGRDYTDVSPVTGIILTAGSQGLAVAVDVIEVEGDAPSSAGAREMSCPAPAHT
ncbi:MAG: transglutaminase family protein [Siculibacillus sp.]|nr:transglutaminase family protein [Siculibacillus sp.]